MRAKQLVAVAAAVDALREQLDAAAAVRDNLVREMRQEGYPAIQIASLMGMNRARVYQIMVEPLPQDDDDVYAQMSERIEDAWQEACQLWAESDGSGTPDDFFPLERLLARR